MAKKKEVEKKYKCVKCHAYFVEEEGDICDHHEETEESEEDEDEDE